MKHLGDITNIHGDKIEPVDCITFGSPCQGLSMAGKRLGFDDNRSVLFLDAARIIKEMRTATNGMYPTFAVWENVPGAFSSNGGEDFRAVLEELARVEQPDASIPRPSGRGGALIQNLRCDADLTDEQVQKIIRIGDRYWEMVGKFKEEDMTPDEFADYITAKSEQVEKELRERWS